MTRLRLLVCSCLVATSSACSFYVDSNRSQCKVNGDCAAIGASYASYVCRDFVCQPPVDPTWACLDGPSTEAPASGKVHVAMTMVDLISQRPLSGVTLTLCAKLDGTCMLPIASFVSDDAGHMDVEMNAGFDGYFQAEGAAIYPALIFPPSTRRQRANSTLPMVPASFFGMMFKGIGVSVADDRSVILTTSLDCLGRPAAGVAIASPQADERTVSYVLAGGVPSRTEPATDETGVGGFVNIAPGSAVITSTLAATNRVVGTAGVQTRAGYLSMVLVMPSGG